MKKIIFIAALAITGFSVYAFVHNAPNPWILRSYHVYGSRTAGRYTWEYKGDPVLEVVDPQGRDLFFCGFTIDGKDHFWLTAGTNRLVDLSLDGYWFRGTVEGHKAEVRPGAKIVLQK